MKPVSRKDVIQALLGTKWDTPPSIAELIGIVTRDASLATRLANFLAMIIVDPIQPGIRREAAMLIEAMQIDPLITNEDWIKNHAKE